MVTRQWPIWWSWEIELTPHLLKRMIDRSFSEVDLRAMLQRAASVIAAATPGRFLVETRHAGRAWHVIVEPDQEAELLVIVTAYSIQRP